MSDTIAREAQEWLAAQESHYELTWFMVRDSPFITITYKGVPICTQECCLGWRRARSKMKQVVREHQKTLREAASLGVRV